MGGCVSKPRVGERGNVKEPGRRVFPASGLAANKSTMGGLQLSPQNGSSDEIWFDTLPWFEAENSEDDYFSVDQDFHPPIRRSPYASLKEGVSKVTAWIAGPSGRLCPDHLQISPVKFSPYSVNSTSIPANTALDRSNFSRSSMSVETSDNLHLSTGVESATMDRTSLNRVMKWDKVLSIDIPCRRPSSLDTSPAGSSDRSNSSDGQMCVKTGKGSADVTKSTFDTSCIPRLLSSVTLRISFKRRTGGESHENYGQALERPLAGSQVPKCSSNKSMEGCWSRVNPSTYKLRGITYFKDKKKSNAPNFAIYEPLGVDVFLTSRKVNHIAQHLELPWQNFGSETINPPPMLIVNAQVPSYPPSVFLGENDGEGCSICMYYRLSDAFKKHSPSHLKEMLQKFVDDDMEKVRGIVGETTMSCRERLKVVARLQNLEELQTSATEKKLMLSYNEKPILSRPQHLFYKGSNYFEIDLDVHRFSYIARKGLDTIRERLKLGVIDFGLIIQAQRPEELPEHVLCAVRLNKLDFGNFKYLNITEAPGGGSYSS